MELQKHKILLVDDEPAILRLLERLFSPQYAVICASSAVEAIELVKQNDFALILSDQRMPGLSGIELLRFVAEIRPQAIRIILTGYTDAGDLAEAVSGGIIYKHVAKPWNNENLKTIAAGAINHYEAEKQISELTKDKENQ